MTSNLKRWYNNPEMIGRHFLVFNDNSRRIKRQYTICSSIDKSIMDQLLALASSVTNGGNSTFDGTFLRGEDQDSIGLTLKTYEVKNGLATSIHNSDVGSDAAFYIKGPMGRGLQLKPTG